MKKELTLTEIVELYLASGDTEEFMARVKDRMNEPELEPEPESIPEPINYRAMVYPKVETQYWYIDRRKIKDCFWLNDDVDQDRFQDGNYFTSWSKAELESDWRIWNTRILNTIAILNKEDNNWVADWTDIRQNKYTLCLYDGIDAFIAGVYSSSQCWNSNCYLSVKGKDKLLTLYTHTELKFWLTKEKSQ